MRNLNLPAAPDMAALQRYGVMRTGQQEVVWSSLYDYQAYAALGQTELNFFQIPVGQSSKTLADTNMNLAGTLPNPQQFLVTNVQCHFWPGGDISAASAIAENVNDVVDVAKSGWLEFYIGSKNYIQEGPIGRFPPSTGIVHSGTEGGGLFKSVYANFGGRLYEPLPLLLMPNVNFRVSLKWPALVPVSAAGRIGIVLEGFLIRESQ